MNTSKINAEYLKHSEVSCARNSTESSFGPRH